MDAEAAYHLQKMKEAEETEVEEEEEEEDGELEEYDEDDDEGDLEDTAQSEADSEIEEMAALWDIPGRVEVSAGALGMPRVILTRKCGAQAEIYLKGANVASWKMPNQSEVLYLRSDVYMEPDKPIAGGIPIIFPQYGPGGDSPGALPGVPDMQQHGFARNCDWEIVATSAKLGMGEDDVGIMFRLTDNEYTRSMWDFPFELTYEVLLGTRSLMCKLTVANPGDTTFPFTAALHPYISTVPTINTRVNVVGLENKQYFDKHGEKLRVRTSDYNDATIYFEDEKGCDAVFVDTDPLVGLNVGTGASVFITNHEGFSDHVVYNPGEKGMGFGQYLNFVCVEPARVARPVKLKPMHMWEGIAELEVQDDIAINVSKRKTELPLFEEDLNRDKHPDYNDRWEYVEEEVYDDGDDLYGDGLDRDEEEGEEE